LPDRHCAVITIAELQTDRVSGGLIANAQFAPTATSRKAFESFLGTIELSETPMTTTPAVFKTAKIFGRDPRLFPTAQISFFTAGDDLVPFTQETILSGSAGRGNSYWDLIVQPGSVWSDSRDNGWSRAGFPFALVNAIEGETHNGVATFAYKEGKITNLRVQIVQQTAPFLVEDYFTASAQLPARLFPANAGEVGRLERSYQIAKKDGLTIAPWEALEKRVGEDTLQDFDDGKEADIVATAVNYDGTLYLKPCETPAGPLPWCERMRFRVWSATKALVNEVALLRLAQKYGAAIFEEKITDYVPQTKTFPGWRAVRFADAINMATGLGNGSVGRNILDGTLDNYGPWYEARTRGEKISAILSAAKPFPWGAGKIPRYRDQDMFMLGVAMDGYLKNKEGSNHSIWSMVLS
jgi:hypothetical protein